MKIMPIDRVNLDDVVKILEAGGLIIYPTETLYGAGVDATSEKAVLKLYDYKKRPFGKPFSIAVDGQKMADDFVELNKTAINLYKHFLPGPMTVISKQKTNGSKSKLATGIASESGTVGVRIPDYKLVTEIVNALGKPITATSANASYKKRPYSIADVLDNLSEKQKSLIDLVIDAGELPHNEPSTVVDTTMDDAMILRQGEILLKDKNEIFSRSEENTRNTGKELWQKYESYAGHRAIVFALEGEMGAGKTQFTKGLARAMGITELVTSPTFALENTYEIPDSRFELHHFDAWRLEKSDELKTLGFSDLIKNKSVISIEWAEKVADEIRKFDDEAIIIWVKIKQGKSENERLISWGVTK